MAEGEFRDAAPFARIGEQRPDAGEAARLDVARHAAEGLEQPVERGAGQAQRAAELRRRELGVRQLLFDEPLRPLQLVAAMVGAARAMRSGVGAIQAAIISVAARATCGASVVVRRSSRPSKSPRKSTSSSPAPP